jgi:hypothetical protein
MKKGLFILVVIFLLMTGVVSAQSYNRIAEKKINPVKGKKLIIKGEIRDSDEISYQFKARKGQKITIKIIGRDADFVLYALHSFDVEPIAEDTHSWSGTLPDFVDGKCEIVVHSNYKVADYRLEILIG